jgi:hypothetical protein
MDWPRRNKKIKSAKLVMCISKSFLNEKIIQSGAMTGTALTTTRMITHPLENQVPVELKLIHHVALFEVC